MSIREETRLSAIRGSYSDRKRLDDRAGRGVRGIRGNQERDRPAGSCSHTVPLPYVLQFNLAHPPMMMEADTEFTDEAGEWTLPSKEPIW